MITMLQKIISLLKKERTRSVEHVHSHDILYTGVHMGFKPVRRQICRSITQTWPWHLQLPAPMHPAWPGSCRTT